MTELDQSTVTDPTTDEACPHCGATDGTRQTSATGPAQAWACDRRTDRRVGT